ncbi:MAG: DUF2807 domain-containing protein, partial [Rhizobiaceae bacterium]
FRGDDCDGEAPNVTGSEGRIAWDGSSKVVIAVPAETRWRRGEGTEVVISGDADDLANIRLHDGAVHVCGDIDDKIEITLPGVDFREITVAGAGELSMEGIEQADLELTVAGAGKVEADGRIDSLKLTIAGAGEARVGKLATKRLKLAIMGAGKAEAAPSDDADVTIMGAGNVDLVTRPERHDFDIMGAGKVNMPDSI